MSREQHLLKLRTLGASLDGRDFQVYSANGKDPNEPIIGEGDPRARLAIFGRDPGREEVKHGVPFIGAGGQKVRLGLHRALFGNSPYDFAASLTAGQHAFWANTVPFKPFENKAWSPKIVREFWSPMAGILNDSWRGIDVITLGEGAFKWFGIPDKKVKEQLHEFWKTEDRFETAIEVDLSAHGIDRPLRLRPLPHPSPLNATWTPLFPGLLEKCLHTLNFSLNTWKLESP